MNYLSQYFVKHILNFVLISWVVIAVVGCGGSGGNGPGVDDGGSSEGVENEPDVLTSAAEGCAVIVTNSDPMPTLLQNLTADCDYYIEVGGIVENLTIEAGTSILMGSDASLQFSKGDDRYLEAIGTVEQPIVIRGLDDDPGYWGAINTSDASVTLEHVTIDGAGGDNRFGNSGYAMSLYESIASISNTTISNSLTGGLRLNRSSFARFAENVFSGNGSSGLSLILPSSDSIIDFLDVETDYSGIDSPNGDSFVRVIPSEFPSRSFTGRFRNINAVYLVDSLVVKPEDQLIIDAGVEFALEERANWRVEGALKANGTVEEPISFSAAPDIDGSFTSISLSSTSVMSHVNISGGGFGGVLGSNPGAIVVTAATRLSNVSIRDSKGWGISCGLFPTSIQVENVSFENNELGNVDPTCTALY